jgi:hypothetical protein
MFIASSSSANCENVQYLSVYTWYPRDGLVGSITRAEHTSVTTGIVFKGSLFPFSVLLMYSLKFGVEAVVRGLKGIHLADRCILTRLE